MERFLEINRIILAVFGVSIFGAMASGFKWLSAKMRIMLEEQKREARVTNEAMIAILHNKIYKNGMDYIDKGCITLGELDDLEKLYRPYHEMGGNSTAEVIMENVRNLEVCKGNVEGMKLPKK